MQEIGEVLDVFVLLGLKFGQVIVVRSAVGEMTIEVGRTRRRCRIDESVVTAIAWIAAAVVDQTKHVGALSWVQRVGATRVLEAGDHVREIGSVSIARRSTVAGVGVVDDVHNVMLKRHRGILS